ncbi:hypothetical protein [Nocardioides terrigena]|nr:hypothetical protein [Nocardioides terrigena]
MTTYDNAPPLADWIPQPGRHCGELCWNLACPICGEYLPTPASIVRGEN